MVERLFQKLVRVLDLLDAEAFTDLLDDTLPIIVAEEASDRENME